MVQPSMKLFQILSKSKQALIHQRLLKIKKIWGTNPDVNFALGNNLYKLKDLKKFGYLYVLYL